MILWYKKWFRRPATAVLWLVLLSAACLLLCLGVLVYGSAVATASSMEEGFVTTAVFTVQGSSVQYDGYRTGSKGVQLSYEMRNLLPELLNNENVIMADERRFMSVYSDGLNPLLSIETEHAYKPGFDSSYDNIILIAEVISADYFETNVPAMPEYNIPEQHYASLNAVIRPYRTLMLNPAYKLPEEIHVFLNSDAIPPVQPGQYCLLFGSYSPSDLIWDEALELFGLPQEPQIPQINLNTNVGKTIIGNSDESELLNSQQETPTFVVIDGTPEDFDFEAYCEEPQNVLWKRAAERCKIAGHAFPLVGTDCFESLMLVNSKNVAVAEGRSFTAEEYSNGSPVCLISDELAQKNGIAVGDSIDFRSYVDGGFFSHGKSGAIWVIGLLTNNPQPALFNPSIGFNSEPVSYEVVGLYHMNDMWTRDSFQFTPNTVFVPNAAITGDHFISLDGMFYSVRIKNGSGDAFCDSLIGTPFEGAFTVIDTGYEAVQKTIQQLRENAVGLLVGGCAAFIVVSVLYALLFVGAGKHSFGVMRSLGQSASSVRCYAIAGNVLPLLAALPVAGALTYLLQERVMGFLFRSAAESIHSLGINAILITLGAEALMLVLLVSLYVYAELNLKPLTLIKGGK